MNPFTPRVRAIVRREYLQRVRSKWFLFSTLVLPVLLVGLGFLAGWLLERGGGTDPAAYRVGIVDRGGRLGPLVAQELRRDGIGAEEVGALRDVPADSLPGGLLRSVFDYYLVLSAATAREMPPGPEAEGGGADAADEAAGGRAGEADEAGETPGARSDRAGEEGPRARLLARDRVSSEATGAVREALDRAVVRGRLEAAGVRGVDTRALLEKMPVRVVSVTESGARSQEVFRAISFFIAFLFYMVLIIYGQMIVRSVLEEKTSDIVEVMVSSVRPWELMVGKIVGVGAVGLTQVAIWGLVVGGFALWSMGAGAAALGFDLRAIGIPVGAVVGVLAFLVLGYLLYAGLFAGAGATLSNEHDAQQAVLPIVFLIVLPFIMAQGVIQNPGAAWAVAVSIIPFFSPLLMPSRMLVSSVPAWELAAALLLLIVSIVLVAWVAGRIYRVGILMKGKRPNLPELFRWVRHG